MAVKWHDIAQDGEEYNLQYRTAGDDRVREAHARLDGVTLPPSDKVLGSLPAAQRLELPLSGRAGIA